MLDLSHFTDRNLDMGFKINLHGHHINHAISNLTITPIYPDFGIAVRYIKKTFKRIICFLW